jgi:hypothetical protein
MSITLLELKVVLLMSLIVIGISVAMEITSDHGLRFIPLGNLYRFKPLFASGYPGVVPHEINEIGPEQKQLSHNGVVVVLL